MKLFNISKASGSLEGFIVVLKDGDVIYGWSDHRGLKLPVGKWIKFRGQNRMVEQPSFGNGIPYPNGFHAVNEKRSGSRPLGWAIEGDILDEIQRYVPSWAKAKHRKRNMLLRELKVELRGVTHVGEIVMADHGWDKHGCVAQEIRLPTGFGLS
ncbi:hypothetical protein LCGC14_1907070 [marine sediment metagenome]|uniref:Uncharacterized protein n=1 Tax=marine sediment metagenome TaxID=412755 RepID=A0A0F9FUT3_9ZZZZ